MNLKDGKTSSCWWKCRYELLGITLLVIASVLTIIAWDSFGIVAMFVVGLVLIGHKHFCYLGCHPGCHEDCHVHDESCGHESHEGEHAVKGSNHKKKA